MPLDTKGSINFQDLMLHRIHEILLVASPYDAFILEEDGRLTQQILYEYLGMNLSYAPRVWHAKDAKTGLKQLADRSYDLVIVMMRIADMDPITFGERVKKTYPDKPVILLAFDESEISMLPQKRLAKTIDRVYIWSGNANVFPAIIKNIEDKIIIGDESEVFIFFTRVIACWIVNTTCLFDPTCTRFSVASCVRYVSYITAY